MQRRTVAGASGAEHRVPQDIAAPKANTQKRRPGKRTAHGRDASGGGTCTPVDMRRYACFKKSKTCRGGVGM
jgi:hypothetical protein